MSQTIVNSLEELRPHSGVRALSAIAGVRGKFQRDGQSPLTLVQPKQISNANWTHILTGGPQSLMHKNGVFARRKVMTIPSSHDHGYTHLLNDALLGGKDYPVISAVFGAIVGAASSGAGLVFSASSTALSVSQTTHRVLTRG